MATETVTRREPEDLREIPAGTVVRYEREIVADGMWNAACERLTDAGPGTTLWECDNEFRFDSAVMGVPGLLVPAVFRRQSRQHMPDFTAFAEQGTGVRG